MAESKKTTEAVFPKLVGERGLLITSFFTLRVVAGATLSRFARLEPPAP
jgi:hypothetical protein